MTGEARPPAPDEIASANIAALLAENLRLKHQAADDRRNYLTLRAEVEARPPAPEALRELEKAARFVLDKFKAAEAQGYRSRERQFAIEVLEPALLALLSSQGTPAPRGGRDE